MGGWDAVIDVSNVCWDEQLPPVGRRRPVWKRLGRVMAAWRDAHGRDVRFDLVADDSLVHDLDDAQDYGELVTRGRILTAPVADTEILALASKHGRHVLTRDHYIDHRPAHRWMEQSPERFHSWTVKGGTISFEPLGVEPLDAQDLSVHIERKLLRGHRIDPVNPRYKSVLETRWQCRNKRCPEHAHWQGQLLVMPLMTKSGEVVCPTCHEPLRDRGHRERLHMIVVESLRPKGEIFRFPAEVSSPVVIGRGLSLKGVNLQVYGTGEFREAVDRVSRRHLRLTVQETATGRRKMAVTDLDSRNGTVVVRPAGAGNPTDVKSGKEVFAMEKDTIVLGGAVSLRFSGARYYASGGYPVPVIRPARDDDGDASDDADFTESTLNGFNTTVLRDLTRR